MARSTRALANLPWYDLPGADAALDTLWTALRGALGARADVALPTRLDRTDDIRGQWRDPRLILSQCCTPDLATADGARLEAFARPVFADLDVPPGCYESIVIAPADREGPADRGPAQRGPADRGPVDRIAINAPTSHSGARALALWCAERGIEPRERLVTGSHAASLERVRRGEADLAAIDAHSLRWLDARGVRVVGRTAPAPAPPFVRHRDAPIDGALLRDALGAAIEARGADAGLVGLVPAGRADDAVGALACSA